MTKLKRRPLILFGGGLDSCALVEQNRCFNPVLLYFDYGQKALAGELRALEYFAAKYRLDTEIVVVPSSIIPRSPLTTEGVVKRMQDHATNYIPGRNLIFSALAFSYAVRYDLGPILLGASPAPPESEFHDAKVSFAASFNALTALAYPIRAPGSESLLLDTPLLLFPLVGEVRSAYLTAALKQEPRLFEVSFTCYEGAGEHECGECVHCQQKAALAKELNASMRPTLRKLRGEK